MAEAEAGVARLQEQAAQADHSLSFSFRVPAILVVLAAGLAVRLLLATFPGFGIDVGTFQAWSFQLADRGPWNFYDTDSFTDYSPGYLYLLWAIGELHQIFHFTNGQYEYILKLPSIVADLASAYLLYRVLEGQKEGVRVGASLAYLLFPATLFIGPIWGQVDSLLAFFLLLSVYFIGRDRPVPGAIAFVVAFLVKPQAIAALPFLAFWILKRNPPRWVPPAPGSLILAGLVLFGLGIAVSLWRYLQDDRGSTLTLALSMIAAGLALLAIGNLLLPREPEAGKHKDRPTRSLLPVPPEAWYVAFMVPALILLLAILPFFAPKPWEFLDQLEFSASYYKYASFHAYNFWSTFAYLEADNIEYLGLSYQIWGYLLFALSTAFVLYSFRQAEGMGALALGTALCILVFYLFVTRMHERYLFPAFLPLLAACVIYNNRWLWGVFLGLGLIHSLNLYHAYAEFNDNHVRVDWMYDWLQDQSAFGLGLTTVEFLSVLMVAMLPPILALAYAFGERPRSSEVT